MTSQIIGSQATQLCYSFKRYSLKGKKYSARILILHSQDFQETTYGQKKSPKKGTKSWPFLIERLEKKAKKIEKCKTNMAPKTGRRKRNELLKKYKNI